MSPSHPTAGEKLFGANLTRLEIKNVLREEKPANGIIVPSLKEFLPLGFMKVKNVEKKIFGDHKALMGTSEIDSKYKYVKLARGLPTFGVHFFLVKVSPVSNIGRNLSFSERANIWFWFDKCNKVTLISPVSAV